MIAATTGLDALAGTAIVPVVVWALVAGTATAWVAHRYRSAIDEAGDEYADLAVASCRRCLHEISLLEVVPGRAGTCASCGRSLPATWLGSQLAVLLGSLAMLATFGARAVLVPFLWLVPVLVTAAVVDLRTMLIPKRVVWVGFGVGLATIAATAAWLGAADTIVNALIGAGAYFGFLFVMHMVSPNGMGFGDVRLALVLGLYLGWIDLRLPLFGLLIGNVVYLCYALPRRLSRGSDDGRYSPFGPGLAMGTLLAVVFYSSLVPT